MGMRKYYRSMAKARMRCVGVKPSLLNSGIMPHGGHLRKKMKTARGRRYLEKLRNEKPPRWRRVLTGDLAAETFKAQMLAGTRIKKRKLMEKAAKKRRIRKIEAPVMQQ